MTRLQTQRRVLSAFSFVAAFSLALFLTGVAACDAETPEASVHSVTLKLPVDAGSELRFAHISTAQGLSQIRVTSIAQDDQGFMWFGTVYGLNRFDGYTFKIYRHERGNPNSLGGVDVDSVFKDRDGALWVGCEQALDRFDPKTETFTHFPIPKVKQTYQDREGLLWLSTDRGLYRFDAKTGKFRVYLRDPNDPASLPDNHVVATFEDKAGRFWVGSPYGIYEFDRTTGHVTLSVPLRTGSRDISFHEDKQGEFWIIYGTGNGLAKFDRERNILTYYSFRDGDLASTAYSGVDAMVEDRHGNLWLAKQGFGLLRFDREHNRFLGYTHAPSDANSLAEDYVIGLFEDRDGSIWVGLPASGLQRFSPVPAAFQPVSTEQKAQCFYEDSQRNLWIGARTALIRIDPSGKRTAFVGVKAGVLFDVLSIVEDRTGFIWAGTSNNGLFRLDPKSGSWKIYRHDENDLSSLSNNVVNRLLVDHEGTLWATTWDGLDRFHPQTQSFTTFKANPHAREQIYLSLAEDAQHDLWLGTFGFGAQHFDPKTGQFTIFRSGDAPGSLSDSEVNWVHIAHDGKVWAGTSNGLNEFDPVTQQFSVYDAREGMASTFIDCMLEDTRGKLWMSTTKGISSFDPATRIFRNFSTAEGLPSDEMAGTGGCLRAASGRMYFAGASGATTFLPEAISENSVAPPTVFTDIRLLGSLQSLKPKISPQAISYASDLTLAHKQTSFSLTFAALAYSNPQANRYRYMLEGVDTSWTEVGSDIRTVTYSGLPARKYRFRVQGATNSSQWSEPGAELEIVILPPWWNTWWFRTCYVAAILLLIAAAYRYRLRQLARILNLRFEERLAERTRIAQELHDTLLQSFQGLTLRFQAANEVVLSDPEEAKEAIEAALDRADQAMTEGRKAIQGIRSDSFSDGDIVRALGELMNELVSDAALTEGNRPATSVVVEGKPRSLHPWSCEELCKIGREALRNSLKHGRAQAVEIEIAFSKEFLRLRFRDDGIGMDTAVLEKGAPFGRWGLIGMKERVEGLHGRLKIWSKPNAGTEVEVTIPASAAFGLKSPRTTVGAASGESRLPK